MRVTLKVVLLLTTWVGLGSADSVSAQLPEGVTAPMIEEGRRIFSTVGLCHTCHLADGTGTALAPDLTDDEWINIDGTYEAIVDLVNSGVAEPVRYPLPMMPRAGSAITPVQIEAVAAYVWSLTHTADAKPMARR